MVGRADAAYPAAARGEAKTLFWHGHFATGNGKVRDTRMMECQHLMLRARGSFGDLLRGILRDPAMLVYLDNGENVKDHPNENFGRELLELFTMGVGNYTEHDIREASRAFTGWTNDGLEFEFDETQHDMGVKTFQGQTGRFDGTDIIDIILAQEPMAEFIAGKLYRYFVREELSDQTRASLGATFRDAGYELEPLLTRIFLSRDFYSPTSYATQIKEPGAAGRLDLSQARSRPDADNPGFQPADVSPRSIVVQPAKRGRMGRRANLDHPRIVAAEGQSVPHNSVPGRRLVPGAGSGPPRNLCERRAPNRGRDEHHCRHSRG